MSNQDRQGWGTGPSVNQFGTPVNQFGTPVNQFGTPQLGTPPQLGARQQLVTPPGAPTSQWGAPQPFAAGGYGQWHPPTVKRRSPARLAVLISLLCVAAVLAVNLGLRYFFPDLSKPIGLPGSVASVGALSEPSGRPITMQSKDSEGRATAMSVYADDMAVPQTMLVVTAGRMKDFGTRGITESTRTIGKVTCTDNVATSTLMAQAGASADARTALRAGLTTGAACWRSGRHLTVVVVALTAHEAAQSTARQAVQEAWKAI